MNDKAKLIIKWTVILAIAVILSVTATVLMFVYCGSRNNQTVNESKQTVAVDGNGNEITDGQTMPERMAFVRTSAANSTASVSVTASITPSDAMYTDPTWTVAWKDSTVAKNVSEYVTVTPNDLTATVTCNKVFTDKIELKFTVKDYYDHEHTKTCELDYLDRVIGIESFTARYLPGAEYITQRSPLPYNTYLNTDPCELDAFYYGTTCSVKYEFGQINLKRSGGTVREEEQEVSMRALSIQYSVSYNGGWVSKVKEFNNADITPYINFCEIIESLDNKTAILSACNNRPLVRLRFTFTDWTTANNSFYMNCKIDYNIAINSVTLTNTNHTFGR